MRTGRPLIDVKGQRFGALTVTGRGASDSRGKPYWVCVCDCGRTTRAFGSDLRSGRMKSCGCLRFTGDTNRTHGLSGTQLHWVWKAMRARCNNPRDPAYKNYGGRGITVCDRWSSFENFLADMGPRPDGQTLERVDNDGHYGPDNCVWDTRLAQAHNKRTRQPATREGE